MVGLVDVFAVGILILILALVAREVISVSYTHLRAHETS